MPLIALFLKKKNNWSLIMYENINLFKLPFDHFYRKGILSESNYNLLADLRSHNKEDLLSIELKNLICDNILLLCLQKKVSGPFDHIVNFYREYSRDDLFKAHGSIHNEIFIHPRLFFLLKDLDSFLLDYVLKSQIVKLYEQIRSELELSSGGDWTLYHVLIHPKFKLFIYSLKIKLEIINK